MNKRTFIIALVLAIVFLFVSSSFGQSSQVAYGWTKIMGGTLAECGLGIATDSSRNIYVTGYFMGTVDFGLNFGTTDIKTSAGSYDIYITKINANGTYGWTKILGAVSSDHGNAVTTDVSGNVYVTGDFQGAVNFGLDFGTSDIKTSAGEWDIFITKINANGTYGWTKIVGGTVKDFGNAITTDSSANVYVAGYFSGTVNFGLDFGTSDIKTSAGGSDISITKINANGTYGWTKVMGGTVSDYAYAVITDSSGNVYITGYFNGTVNFGLDFGTSDIKTSAGGWDIFITKINANGTYGWTKIMGGTGEDFGHSITTDSSGNVYVTGCFVGTVNFGLDFGTTDTKTSAGASDTFITKINANGTYAWTKIMGGTFDEWGYSIATNSSGNVYVTGFFNGTVNFGLDFGTTDIKTSGGYYDIYVTEINANGAYGWTKIIGGTVENDIGGGYAITTDSSSNVYVTGFFNGTVNFGLDFGTTDIKTSTGNSSDIYVTKLMPASGYYVLDGYGGVHRGGNAPALSPQTEYFGWDRARDIELTPSGTGYYVLDCYGGAYRAGSAPSFAPPIPYFGWDIAKDLELTSDGTGYYILEGYGGVHPGGPALSLSPSTPYFGWNIARDFELTPSGTGYYVLDGYGGVHAGGDASSLSPSTPYFGWDIARDLELTPSGTGYYVLDGYGGVHAGGSASSLSPSTPYFGFDIAKDLELTSDGLGCYVLDGYGGVHKGGNAPSFTPATPYFGWNIARGLALLR
jgi:hypothetical protein